MSEVDQLRLEVLRRQTAAKLQAATQSQPIMEVGGGQVFRMGDGSLSFKSPGYATNDQDTIKRLIDGASQKQEIQTGFDQEILSQAPVRARVQEFSQGTPLVGEWFDEAIEGVSPNKARNSRVLSDAMERQNPYESVGLNVAGGIATSLPAAVAAGPTAAGRFISAGKGLFSTGGRAALVGGGAGAVEGASTFAGRAEEGDRAGAAVEGAAVGGALGGLVGAIAPILGKGASAAVERIRELDVKSIVKEFGISRQAAAIVKGHLANEDFASAASILSRSDDAMLAESGPASRNLLDTAMQTGGEALSTGKARVDQRVKTAASGWLDELDTILGGSKGGIKGTAKEMAQSTAPARKAAYDFAYSQPTPTVGAAADDIGDALSRVNPKLMSQAVERANNAMRAEGLVNRNIMASIDDATGEVTFSQPLNIMQMDYIKRALGEIADDGTDKMTGAVNNEARLASRLAGRLSDALKEHIPGYEKALKIGGDTIRDRNALVMGRKLLSRTTTVEDVREAFKGASKTERAAAKAGLRENIEAIIENARTTIADLEAGNLDFATGQNDVAQAVAAVRNLMTKANVTKANIVLGKDGQRLMAELEKMADAMVLRSAVARNSATAIRTAGREAIEAQTQPGLAKRAIGGLSPSEVSSLLVGSDKGTVSRQQAQYMSEIADALTRIKGPDALRALGVVRKAMQGQPVRQAEADLVGRLIASGSTLAGERAGAATYRTATQPIGPQ